MQSITICRMEVALNTGSLTASRKEKKKNKHTWKIS